MAFFDFFKAKPEATYEYWLIANRPCHCGSLDFRRSRLDGAYCAYCGTLYFLFAKNPPAQVVKVEVKHG